MPGSSAPPAPAARHLDSSRPPPANDAARACGHLARAVAGVTDRPFQLGDPIYEFCRTPIGPQEVEWQITEHDRPHHAKLQAGDGTTFTYTFIGKGDDTSFRRVFELGSELGAQQPPPYTSDTARAENANVKALVEKVLWREQKGPNLP